MSASAINEQDGAVLMSLGIRLFHTEFTSKKKLSRGDYSGGMGCGTVVTQKDK